MTAYTVYNEFIDDNMTKRYPFVDIGSSSIEAIPSSFLVDASICIGTMDREGDSSYRYHVYVSEIQVYPDYAYVIISDDVSGSVIAKSDPISLALDSGSSVEERTIRVRPTGDLPVNGTLVIGTCEDISDKQGVLKITDPDEATLFPTSVVLLPIGVSSIIVGDTEVTGDVVLEAGDNIDITYDKTDNVIKISVVNTDNVKVDDEYLIQAVTSVYGQPVLTVNGISPDSTGNIKILPTDCLMVETDSANHSISFYNPCGTTCASDSFMSDVYARISDLNRSVGLLTSFYTSVSNTLAQMGVRVSSVLEARIDTEQQGSSE